MKRSYFVLCVWMTLLAHAYVGGTVTKESDRSLMTFRQCLDKCVSKNYHGDSPSTVCSFGRSATFRQSWDGAPVRVNPSAAAPIYGQMASYDERFPAGDVRRTSKTLSRVIRGIVRDRRKDSSSETSSREDYVNICYNCISGTCRPYIFFG
ncbi:uncharacterized protein LOC128193020 [Crassostrea angulata]|uniref:uncharacterized protein LOC128193020 n=1 Tax=Magallana angulata TaxID=2784310 RepID=UPI0022B1B3B0|nr:uncharacterized protein LOC128193020 [Crassostrea angulata]